MQWTGLVGFQDCADQVFAEMSDHRNGRVASGFSVGSPLGTRHNFLEPTSLGARSAESLLPVQR